MKSAIEELKSSREMLFSRFPGKEGAAELLSIHTGMLDRYFKKALQESRTGQLLLSGKRPFALVALGGYGRKELCLHSDIDIMILFNKGVPEKARALAHEILFPLWDLGLDMGYAVRSLKECLRLAEQDFQVFTSVMDARLLCGDSSVFLDHTKMLQKKIIPKKADAFAKWLKRQHQARMIEFGDSSYLLEPDLKEGIGGLRDYHGLLWLARAFFQIRTPRDLEYTGILSHMEYLELMKNLEFIWQVRNHLHSFSTRKKDRLDFEHQELIARRLGIKDRGGQLAVERFMGRLHASMASIKALYRSFLAHHLGGRETKGEADLSQRVLNGLHIHKGEICFDSAEVILSCPFLLMEVFEQGAVAGLPLSLEAERLVREFLFLVDDDFRESDRVTKSFLSIINNARNTEALDRMFETGLLDAFIPEFARIRDRVQFDSYHIFPVGRHSLEAVRYLKEIAGNGDFLFVDIFTEIDNSEPLFLAALFHDLGKTEKDHSKKGAVLTSEILGRLEYNEKKADDILFLISNHLLLIETATKRDLNDEKAVVRCARKIETIDRLKMLYLLTWADSMATGPKAWSDWIASLVLELFFKVLHILEQGELATPDASLKAGEAMAEVLKLWSKQTVSPAQKDFFEALSPRYILNVAPGDIVRHKRMARRLDEKMKTGASPCFILEIREDPVEGCWKADFLAQDRPGLFSDIAGVMALNNINIFSARIFTWRDNTAVDMFRLSTPPDPLHQDETWEKVKKDLEHAFIGKLSLPYRLGQKSRPTFVSGRVTPPQPPGVTVDNRSSDFFTLIEVLGDDHVGRLYFITRALFDLRLDISIAKIATKGDQIADIFYVRDLEGQKVEDGKRIKEIRESILYQLKGM